MPSRSRGVCKLFDCWIGLRFMISQRNILLMSISKFCFNYVFKLWLCQYYMIYGFQNCGDLCVEQRGIHYFPLYFIKSICMWDIKLLIFCLFTFCGLEIAGYKGFKKKYAEFACSSVNLYPASIWFLPPKANIDSKKFNYLLVWFLNHIPFVVVVEVLVW
jgi:hypothetical protein